MGVCRIDEVVKPTMKKMKLKEKERDLITTECSDLRLDHTIFILLSSTMLTIIPK